MNRTSFPAPPRPSALVLFVAVLASCGGTAAAAGLALEWLDGRDGAGLAVLLAVLALMLGALGLAAWAALRRDTDELSLRRLPTVVLLPQPRGHRTEPPVARMVQPRKRRTAGGVRAEHA